MDEVVFTKQCSKMLYYGSQMLFIVLVPHCTQWKTLHPLWTNLYALFISLTSLHLTGPYLRWHNFTWTDWLWSDPVSHGWDQSLWLFRCIQQCSPGFTRISEGRYLGRCVGCNCHGHSDECDDAGQCLVSKGQIPCDQFLHNFSVTSLTRWQQVHNSSANLLPACC